MVNVSFCAFKKGAFFCTNQSRASYFDVHSPYHRVYAGGSTRSTKTDLTSNVLRSWKQIYNGVTPATTTTRQKYWRRWTQYCRCWNRFPYLIYCPELEYAIITIDSTAHVRIRLYGYGDQIKVQSVMEALSVISKTIKLARK